VVWQVSSQSSLYTVAFLWAVYQATDTANTRGADPSQLLTTQISDFVRQPATINEPIRDFQYMSSGWYSTPADHTFGTVLTGASLGTRLHGYDIGLLKNFHFTESNYLQFGETFLNAFNNGTVGHPKRTSPVTLRIDPTSPHRKELQFALKSTIRPSLLTQGQTLLYQRLPLVFLYPT